jgi:hypothetical protein
MVKFTHANGFKF